MKNENWAKTGAGSKPRFHKFLLFSRNSLFRCFKINLRVCILRAIKKKKKKKEKEKKMKLKFNDLVPWIQTIFAEAFISDKAH